MKVMEQGIKSRGKRENKKNRIQIVAERQHCFRSIVDSSLFYVTGIFNQKKTTRSDFVCLQQNTASQPIAAFTTQQLLFFHFPEIGDS